MRSRYTRSVLGDPERLGYGSDGFAANEGIELFHPVSEAAAEARTPAPVVLFVHGGAWKAGRAADYNFLAETFVRAGFAFALADFSPVQAFDGDLSKMAQSVGKPLGWLFHHAKALNIDPARIHLVGHSSGAHLASVLLTQDFHHDELPANLIKAAVLVSGLYDLEPVRLSVRSSYVRISDTSEEALSPIRHIKNIKAPLLVAWASLETPEFLRQSKDFARALESASHPVKTLVLEECNHFEGIETLADPYSPLAREALAMFTALRA